MYMSSLWYRGVSDHIHHDSLPAAQKHKTQKSRASSLKERQAQVGFQGSVLVRSLLILRSSEPFGIDIGGLLPGGAPGAEQWAAIAPAATRQMQLVLTYAKHYCRALDGGRGRRPTTGQALAWEGFDSLAII